MAYQDFVNDFRKDITGDVLFFYGAEDFLMDWAIQQIIGKYVDEEYRNLDVQYLDGLTCTADEIMGSARAYSMFSARRVIIVTGYLPLFRKSGEVSGEELLEFCEQKQDSSVVIFVLGSKYENEITAFGKKMIKACNSYEFARLDKAALQAFINKRVHAAGKMLGHREMNFLIDVTGYYNRDSSYTLSQLDGDLEKITGACEGDVIDNNLIEDLLVGAEDRYVFNLIDALMEGNKGRAMEIAEAVISEDDGSMAVLSLLGKQLEIMYDALEMSREGMSIQEMVKRTGIHEFRFKKAYQAARHFKIERIRDILISVYNINRDIKTGAIDKDVAFELLIVSI